jgi:hypothetical protein
MQLRNVDYLIQKCMSRKGAENSRKRKFRLVVNSYTIGDGIINVSVLKFVCFFGRVRWGGYGC